MNCIHVLVSKDLFMHVLLAVEIDLYRNILEFEVHILNEDFLAFKN